VAAVARDSWKPAAVFFNDQSVSLVDISHRHIAIAVAGCRAREVINAGCPLDLHDTSFPAGSATRTLLGKSEIILMRTGSAQVYRIECLRSFATYVHNFLSSAAGEFMASAQ
jgi:sarcosine oxidase subunit gamma